jgi:hypothetical protein
MALVQAQVNAEALPLSCCALAMDGNYVLCSGWLRKSPPEKKLRFCVSARPGWVDPVAGRGQGSVFSVGQPSP